MKEKTVKNKATVALLRSNIRRGTQEWALAKNVNSAPALLPGGGAGRAGAEADPPVDESALPCPGSDLWSWGIGRGGRGHALRGGTCSRGPSGRVGGTWALRSAPPSPLSREATPGP